MILGLAIDSRSIIFVSYSFGPSCLSRPARWVSALGYSVTSQSGGLSSGLIQLREAGDGNSVIYHDLVKSCWSTDVRVEWPLTRTDPGRRCRLHQPPPRVFYDVNLAE